MQQISTIGIDLAKTIFQLPAIDGKGKIVIQKALKCKAFCLFRASCHRVRPA